MDDTGSDGATGRSGDGGTILGRRYRRLLLAVGVPLLLMGVIVTLTWPSPVEREATRWLGDFQKVRAAGNQRIPGWPLSFEAQKELARRLTRPESSLARPWENLRRRFPAPIRARIPRLPMGRDRLMVIGPALIEIPKMPALQMALLEAALPPSGSNRRFAVQFATMDWPVPVVLLPLLERLSRDPDAAVRSQVTSALQGIPGKVPAVERLLAELQADQVSVVREAARSRYRSEVDSESVSPPQDDAQNP